VRLRAVAGLVLLVACGGKPTELMAWLDDWEAARACLVGAHGLGEDTATATAIAELSRGACRIDAGLRYPGLPDDRSDPPIASWERATAQVDHLQYGTAQERGAAIDAIDAEVAGLRAAVGKPPIERVARRPIATLPAGRELTVDTSPLIVRVAANDAGEFNMGAIRGTTAAGELLATALDDVRSGPTDGDPAWPSFAWNVEALRDQGAISIGLPGKPRVTVPVAGGDLDVMFAIDGPDARVVLVETMGDGPPYAIVVSTDGGARWRVVPAPALGRLSGWGPQDPRTGGVDLLVSTVGYVYRHAWHPGSAFWRAVTAPGKVTFPELPDTPIPWPERTWIACANGGVAWTVDDYTAVRIDDAGFTPLKLHDVSFGFDVDCRGDTMVVRNGHPDRVERCRGAACEIVHQTSFEQRGAAAILDDGRWIYAAIIDGIAGVWREGAPAAFYRLAAPTELRAITVLRGVPHLVLGETDQPYRFVPLP
jgi:hypothetical protein